MYDSEYDDIRRKIEKRYKERLGLIIHFAAFAISNVLFWGMWLFMGSDVAVFTVDFSDGSLQPLSENFPWPMFITLGWGIGIVAHFLNYYYRYGKGANQREEAIQREVEREMARRAEAGYLEKPKNDQRMQLTEDGELEAVPDDEIYAEKSKREL